MLYRYHANNPRTLWITEDLKMKFMIDILKIELMIYRSYLHLRKSDANEL